MSNPTELKGTVGYLLSDDMIFSSRIIGTARACQVTVQPAPTVKVLEALAKDHLPQCLIIDLANPGLDIDELIQQVRAICSPMPFVVAYGSHVDTGTLKKARAAGCDLVLPRSKFVEDLADSLPAWMTKTKNIEE